MKKYIIAFVFCCLSGSSILLGGLTKQFGRTKEEILASVQTLHKTIEKELDRSVTWHEIFKQGLDKRNIPEANREWFVRTLETCQVDDFLIADWIVMFEKEIKRKRLYRICNIACWTTGITVLVIALDALAEHYFQMGIIIPRVSAFLSHTLPYVQEFFTGIASWTSDRCCVLKDGVTGLVDNVWRVKDAGAGVQTLTNVSADMGLLVVENSAPLANISTGVCLANSTAGLHEIASVSTATVANAGQSMWAQMLERIASWLPTLKSSRPAGWTPPLCPTFGPITEVCYEPPLFGVFDA